MTRKFVKGSILKKKKNLQITSVTEGVEKREPSNSVGRNEIGAVAGEKSMAVPQKKKKNRVTMRYSNPTPGHTD